ncbi:MAG: hypothetical protein R3B96_08405 [Pirellulaceae bacterium]
MSLDGTVDLDNGNGGMGDELSDGGSWQCRRYRRNDIEGSFHLAAMLPHESNFGGSRWPLKSNDDAE